MKAIDENNQIRSAPMRLISEPHLRGNDETIFLCIIIGYQAKNIGHFSAVLIVLYRDAIAYYLIVMEVGQHQIARNQCVA